MEPFCKPKDESSLNVNSQAVISLWCFVIADPKSTLLGGLTAVEVKNGASILDVKEAVKEQYPLDLNIAAEELKVWRPKGRTILANTRLLRKVVNSINFSDESQVEALSNSQRVELLELADLEIVLVRVDNVILDRIPRNSLEKGRMKEVFTGFVKRKLGQRMTTYFKDPLLPLWTPPGDPDEATHRFYERLAIPVVYNMPNLILHEIAVGDDHRVDALFCDGTDYRILCNTSGSGKTSLLFKGLCRYWGFYFCVARDGYRLGTMDLEAAIDGIEKEKMSNPTRKEHLERNESIASTWALKVLLLRWSVFAAFIEVAMEQNRGELPLDIKYKWLVFQSVALKFAVTDPSAELIRDFPLDKATNEEIEQALSEFSLEHVLGSGFESKDAFFLVLDQARVTRRQYVGRFANDHPVLDPIVRAWKLASTGQRVKFIVSGTGSPLIRFREILTLSTGDTWDVFSDTGDFSSRAAQEFYLSRYLPPTFLSSNSGKKLLSRVFKWLCGRYSFTASFITLLLTIHHWTATGPRSPHKMLNAFFHYNTGLTPTDYDNSALALEPDKPEPCIRCFLWEKLQSNDALKKQLSASLDIYEAKKIYPMWHDENQELVEYGLARFGAELGETVTVHIQEPIALAGIQNFLKAEEKKPKPCKRKRKASLDRDALMTEFTSQYSLTAPYSPAFYFGHDPSLV